VDAFLARRLPCEVCPASRQESFLSYWVILLLACASEVRLPDCVASRTEGRACLMHALFSIFVPDRMLFARWRFLSSFLADSLLLDHRLASLILPVDGLVVNGREAFCRVRLRSLNAEAPKLSHLLDIALLAPRHAGLVLAFTPVHVPLLCLRAL